MFFINYQHYLFMNKIYFSLVFFLGITSACNSKVQRDQPSDNEWVSVAKDNEVIGNVSSGLKMSVSDYKKSDKYCNVSMKVEWPAGDDAVSSGIRKALVKEIDACLAFEGDDRSFAAYQKETSSLDDAVMYYGTHAYKFLTAASAEDNAIRVESARDFAKENGKKFEVPDIAVYSIDFKIAKKTETDAYCVFGLEQYDYSGGAHGSSVDVGGMTFSKKDGKRFTAFLKPSVIKTLQPLLRKGLREYFSKGGEQVTDAGLKDMLQIEGTMIPLPANTPYPSSKGLVFCYAQYEIACYAAGKPTFCVPYSEIKPFLTAEALTLLGQ